MFGNLSQLSKSCFAAGTPLLTPDGSKRIEDFRVGDILLSAPENDPRAPIQARRVEEVFQRVSPLIELRVGGRSIKTTVEHPFYVDGRGWTKGGALSAGDLLRCHDGRTTPVETIVPTDEIATVYNLRITEYHTYFVGAEAWGFSVWAHNTYRLANLVENVSVTPIGPSMSFEEALNAGLSYENIACDTFSEAESLATEISQGMKPIHDANQFHFHPVDANGAKMPNHIFY
jgi:hypothetical protein